MEKSNKTLSVIITSIGKESNEKLLNTIDTIPWCSEITTVIYSDDSERTIDLLRENGRNLNSIDPEEESKLLVCELKDSEGGVMKNAGIEDMNSDFITFLDSGDMIIDFENEMLDSDSGLPSYNDDPSQIFGCYCGSTCGEYIKSKDEDENNLSMTSIREVLQELRMIPISEKGIIYSTEWLKKISKSRFSTTTGNTIKFVFDSLLKGKVIEFPVRYDLDNLFSVKVAPKLKNPVDDMKTIDLCKKIWSELPENVNHIVLRDYLWNRMSRSAANIIKIFEGRSEVVEDYYRYLFRENMLNVLK